VTSFILMSCLPVSLTNRFQLSVGTQLGAQARQEGNYPDASVSSCVELGMTLVATQDVPFATTELVSSRLLVEVAALREEV